MPPRKRTAAARKPAATAKKPAAAAAKKPPPASKREATRRLLLDRALRLFQQRGVDATTMRDIAKAAGLSLGAAYYYFPSKEAMVFAFYDDNQAAIDEVSARATGTVRERLGAVLHGKLASIAPHRAMLLSILPHLVDPGDPLSAFSQQTRAVRERAIAVLVRALDGSGLPPAETMFAAHALWLLQLASMLVFVHDPTANGARTHGLVDDGLDMIVPMLPFLGTFAGRALCARATDALARAGIPLVGT